MEAEESGVSRCRYLLRKHGVPKDDRDGNDLKMTRAGMPSRTLTQSGTVRQRIPGLRLRRVRVWNGTRDHTGPNPP